MIIRLIGHTIQARFGINKLTVNAKSVLLATEIYISKGSVAFLYSVIGVNAVNINVEVFSPVVCLVAGEQTNFPILIDFSSDIGTHANRVVILELIDGDFRILSFCHPLNKGVNLNTTYFHNTAKTGEVDIVIEKACTIAYTILTSFNGKRIGKWNTNIRLINPYVARINYTACAICIVILTFIVHQTDTSNCISTTSRGTFYSDSYTRVHEGNVAGVGIAKII